MSQSRLKRNHRRARNIKSNDENEDPFSQNHPQNKKQCKQIQNKKGKHEWDANQRVKSDNNSTTFNFTINIDNKHVYDKHKYDALELQKHAKSKVNVIADNKRFDIWLTVSSKNLSMIDINLYSAQQITLQSEQNMLAIHLQHLSDFNISNKNKRTEISKRYEHNTQTLDILITIHGDDTMQSMFEFILYLNEYKPSDVDIPKTFKTLSLPRKISQSSRTSKTRKHSKKNAGGFVPTLTQSSGRMRRTQPKRLQLTPIARKNGSILASFGNIDDNNDKENNDNNIEHCDARSKYEYQMYLDSRHSVLSHAKSVGNGSKHSRAQKMCQAAKDPNANNANSKTKSGQAALRRYDQMNFSGKKKGGYIERKRHSNNKINMNKNTYKRDRNQIRNRNRNDIQRNKSLGVLSTKYSSGRSGDQIGFKNLGNTCYLNAILRSITCLQCFTTDLRRKYVTYLGQKVLNGSNSLYRTYLELIFEDRMNKLNLVKKKNNAKILNPRALKTIIGSMAKMFASYKQQDAHELLSFILNAFHDEIYKAIAVSYDDDDDECCLNKEELEWLSPIHSNFHFQIESEYECTQCGYKRNKIESFREMSLDLPLMKDELELMETKDDNKEQILDQLKDKLLKQAPNGCPEHRVGENLAYRKKGKCLEMFCIKCNDAQIGSIDLPKELTDYDLNQNKNYNEQMHRKQINTWTLNELLCAYFVRKVLEYKCEHNGCNNNRVYVSSWFKRIPRILVLHLKRFVPNYYTGSYTKSHDKVVIKDTLNVNSFCNETLSVPPSSLGVFQSKANEDRDSMDVDQDTNIVNDGDAIYEKIFDKERNTKLFQKHDALETYNNLSDLPPKIQQKSLKCEQEKEEDDKDEDDDIVILNANNNNGHNHNKKPKLTEKLEKKYGTSAIPKSFMQSSANATNTDAVDDDASDLYTKQEAEEKANFWDQFQENWRTEFSRDKCENALRLNSGTKEYCEMYLKYWKSIDFHETKSRKRKREETINDSFEEPNHKRARVETDVESAQNKLISFELNGNYNNDAIDSDEKCSQPTKQKQAKITDYTQKQKAQDSDLERAIAASMKTVSDDEQRRRRRRSKQCTDDDDDDDNYNDKQLQKVLAESVAIQNLSDLCNENVKYPPHPNESMQQYSKLNEFKPVCDDRLLPDIKYTQYHLRSIVRHLGTTYHCGHYITDVLARNKENKNVWKRHDDQYVSSITDQAATNDKAQQNAYIFFYVHESALDANL